MTNNFVKYEVFVKQYLRAILDISEPYIRASDRYVSRPEISRVNVLYPGFKILQPTTTALYLYSGKKL